MPILTGMEALVRIKAQYDYVNSIRNTSESGNQIVVLRPLICYLSQSSQSIMKQFITENE